MCHFHYVRCLNPVRQVFSQRASRMIIIQEHTLPQSASYFLETMSLKLFSSLVEFQSRFYLARNKKPGNRTVVNNSPIPT